MNVKAYLTTQKIPQRVVTYICGLFLGALGMDLFVYADLGNTAVTTVAMVLEKVSGLQLGSCMVLFYCVFVVMEILLLGKDFKWINIGQVPFALILGSFIDFIGLYLPASPPETMAMRWGVQLVGTVLLAFGIILFVGAELVPMPVEGFCLALSTKTPFAFHQCKMIVDCTSAVVAIVLSLTLFGQLIGVGFVTIFLAFALGWTMGVMKPHLPLWMQDWRLGQIQGDIK